MNVFFGSERERCGDIYTMMDDDDDDDDDDADDDDDDDGVQL